MKVKLQREIAGFKEGDTVNVSPFVGDYLNNTAKNEKAKEIQEQKTRKSKSPKASI